MKYKIITAEEAASFLNNGDIVGFSGFTPAGSPSTVPDAISRRAEELHRNGKEFKIGMYTGASTGALLDGSLAKSKAVIFRTPYQSNGDMRNALNSGEVSYFDMHLSHLSQELRYGFMPKPKFAIIEACHITEDGDIVLTSGVGISPTICRLADHIIIELNEAFPQSFSGIHDIYEPNDPPYRQPIPLSNVNDRIGSPILKIDHSKVIGVVKANNPVNIEPFTAVDEVTSKIGDNVAKFLEGELKAGRIPKEFLPIQSGVGNIANAVLGALGSNENIPPFEMYTEVIQDSVIGLIRKGRVRFVSGCSLTVSKDVMPEIIKDIDFFKDRVILRPQEISNNPEIVRRLGLITINTALEADIFGNINSTHILGTKMMNGLGGSGDFTRNAYISIYTCPSVAKGGKISAIVPLVSHTDHSEHSVKILITEQGIADLRGKSPRQRAEEIINNCVHPDYRNLLRQYLNSAPQGHTPLNLNNCFEMHKALAETGDMHNAKF
ncbi:MAG: acetyl-CoA hydrolase [Bacteroidales bacterium]|nr:MAG: acetyl-CoA hydrolase [Bacteroidales bacterium]